MKLPLLSAVLVLSAVGLALPAHAAPSGSLSAREVMDRSEAAQRLRDVTATATLVTGEANGDTRAKAFTMWRRLETDQVHFATLTRFSAPAEIRAEAILFEERAGDENDVELYLPRYKKVRRVETQSQSASFMGSVLSYSDIATPHIDDYTHMLLRTEACPGGGDASCYVLELTPKTEEIAEHTGYGRSVEWVRADIFMAVQTELYDRKGALWKRIVASDIREIDPAAHRYFTRSLRVDDLHARRFTTLSFDEVHANTGLSDALFTTQNLAREM